MNPRQLLDRAWGQARRRGRSWAPAPVAIRVVLLASGGVALLLAPAGRLVLPGLAALVGVAGLVAALVEPDSSGPAIVVGAAATAWALRYGTHPPPVGDTLILAAALALHHQSAALAGALPMTAAVDAEVLLRFAAHTLTVLGLSGAVALLALGLARPGGSVPLELAGLVGAVLLTAVPVLLARLSGNRSRGPG